LYNHWMDLINLVSTTSFTWWSTHMIHASGTYSVKSFYVVVNNGAVVHVHTPTIWKLSMDPPMIHIFPCGFWLTIKHWLGITLANDTMWKLKLVFFFLNQKPWIIFSSSVWLSLRSEYFVFIFFAGRVFCLQLLIFSLALILSRWQGGGLIIRMVLLIFSAQQFCGLSARSEMNIIFREKAG
jgi:hypothetical protein